MFTISPQVVVSEIDAQLVFQQYRLQKQLSQVYSVGAQLVREFS
jgi:hypothetical protein